jgi:uncharacterized membrane protein YkvI
MSVRSVLAWVAVFVCFVCGVVVRFAHPALTETQLFLRYWWLWLITVAFVLIAAFATGEDWK